MMSLRGSALVFVAVISVALSSCTGASGPNVPGIYPTPISTAATVAPTSAATTAPTSVPTSAASSAPTTAASSGPTGAASQTPTTAPTSAPTGAPTSAPTTAPTSAPTSSSTSTAAQCPPPTPYPSPVSSTFTLSANTGTITLPAYQDVIVKADIPMITGGLPATVTVKGSRTNYDNAPAPPMGTAIAYFSFILNSNSSGVTFSTNMVPVHVTSPCSVMAGHTYNAYGYAAGTQIEAKTNLSPNSSGNTVDTTLDIPALYGDTFPSNTLVDIVVSEN